MKTDQLSKKLKNISPIEVKIINSKTGDQSLLQECQIIHGEERVFGLFIDDKSSAEIEEMKEIILAEEAKWTKFTADQVLLESENTENKALLDAKNAEIKANEEALEALLETHESEKNELQSLLESEKARNEKLAKTLKAANAKLKNLSSD